MIKDEVDRNNKYLDFAQSQIERDRGFYKHLASVLGVIVVAAGFFTAISVNQMRTDMEKSLDAELKRLQAEAAAATMESKQRVADELTNVRSEVQKRVENEFRSENINATVRDAAQRVVGVESRRLIDEEVAKQVANVVAEERSAIDAAARLANLVQEARDVFQPDRRAFDELVRIGGMNNAVSASAKEAVAQIIQQWEDKFKDPKCCAATDNTTYDSPEELEQRLSAAGNIVTRRAALLSYVPAADSGERAVPALMKIILNDSDLYLVAMAMFRFNRIEHTSFRVGDWAKANAYWMSRRR